MLRVSQAIILAVQVSQAHKHPRHLQRPTAPVGSQQCTAHSKRCFQRLQRLCIVALQLLDSGDAGQTSSQGGVRGCVSCLAQGKGATLQNHCGSVLCVITLHSRQQLEPVGHGRVARAEALLKRSNCC